MTGPGEFHKTGPGRVVLNAANSFSGGLHVDGGLVQVQGSNGLLRLTVGPITVTWTRPADYYGRSNKNMAASFPGAT